MTKFLLAITLSFLLILSPFLAINSLAIEKDLQNKEVNSFELFWPLVAGKTKAQKYYSLKLFKENLRGSLIFGKFQKADYILFLTTKRLLEAEKLADSDDKKNSLETFDMASDNLKKIEQIFESSTDISKSSVDSLNLKFDNLEVYLPWLESKYKGKEFENKVKEILDKTVNLHKKI